MSRRRKQNTYCYKTFNDLEREMNPYDLSNAMVLKKDSYRGQRGRNQNDVSIYLRSDNSKRGSVLGISFELNAYKTKIKTNRCRIAIIKDRLYFVNDEDNGYKISTKSSRPNFRIIVSNEEYPIVELFKGDHIIEYDKINDLFFVSSNWNPNN